MLSDLKTHLQALTRHRAFDWGLLAALLLPLIGILPMLSDQVINTADGPLHVHRIYAMTTLLESGDLWPRWVSWFHLGFGYPVFNYYPPGVFYLGGLLGLLGISAPLAFNLISAFAWSFGSAGTYLLGKKFLPPYGALLAAALWAYAPSRLFEVWDQGSLPQIMAGACIPWVFWGLVSVCERPTRRTLVGLALPLAGLILSHQPLTLMMALFLIPAGLLLPLWYSRQQRNTLWRRCGAVFGAAVLAACLTAIFVLPLALELRYVAGSQQADDTIPYLISNFLQPQEIFAQPSRMDLTDLRFELPTTFGLLAAVLALPGAIALIRLKRYGVLLGLGAALAFLMFMLVEASLPLWTAIPYFAQLRFPERFLRIGAVLLAVLGASGLLLLPRRWQWAGAGVGITAAVVAALPLLYPVQETLDWSGMTARDEIAFELATAAWGTTSYDEFDPIWGERIPRPSSGAPEPEAYASDPLRVVGYRNDMNRDYPDLQIEQVAPRTLRITVTEARPVRFHQYYFPGWTAIVDGTSVTPYAEDEYGLLTLDLPAGTHIVELAFHNTPIRTLGTLITLVSVGVTVIFIFPRTSGSDMPLDTERLDLRYVVGVGGAVITFALVNTFWIVPHTRWFRFESPPDQPALMEQAVRQPFGDAFILLGYTLHQDSVAAGGLLNVALFWQPQRALDRQYRPIVQLVNQEVSAAWGVSEPFFPGGGDTRIGYTPDVFASDLHEIRIFADAPAEIGYLSVQMIDVAMGEALRLSDGADRLILPAPVQVIR